MNLATPNWLELIVTEDDPATAWKGILVALRDVALQSGKASSLDRMTVAPDRLLANTAWNLWDEFLHYAPTVVNELKQFWVQTTAFGTAVLILDALSLRELPLIAGAANDRGIKPIRADAVAAQIPKIGRAH